MKCLICQPTYESDWLVQLLILFCKRRKKWTGKKYWLSWLRSPSQCEMRWEEKNKKGLHGMSSLESNKTTLGKIPSCIVSILYNSSKTKIQKRKNTLLTRNSKQAYTFIYKDNICYTQITCFFFVWKTMVICFNARNNYHF